MTVMIYRNYDHNPVKCCSEDKSSVIATNLAQPLDDGLDLRLGSGGLLIEFRHARINRFQSILGGLKLIEHPFAQRRLLPRRLQRSQVGAQLLLLLVDFGALRLENALLG